MSKFGLCTLFGCLAFGAVDVIRIHVLTKVSLSCLLLVVEVCNTQSTFRKPKASNLLGVSDLTLGHYSEVKKLWLVNIIVPLSCLLVVQAVHNVQSTFRTPHAVNVLVVSYLTLN